MNADQFQPPLPSFDSAGVHIVRGIPDDEEVAALVAGLAAYSILAEESIDDPPVPGPNRWVRGRVHDWNPHTTPDTWRWSGRS